MSSTSSGSTRNSKHTAGGMEQRHKAKVHNNSKSKKKEKVKKDKKTNSKKASKDTVAKSNKSTIFTLFYISRMIIISDTIAM